VRAYVMGERGSNNEPATAAEIDEMARIVAEAIRAGARGFSTSRTIGHRALSGEPVPGTFAPEEELFAIGRAVKAAGKGLFEVAPSGVVPTEDHISPDLEVDWMCRLAEEVRREADDVEDADALWHARILRGCATAVAACGRPSAAEAQAVPDPQALRGRPPISAVPAGDRPPPGGAGSNRQRGRP